MTTYARPQDYALDPQSDECKEWPECEMNAEEEEGLLMIRTKCVSICEYQIHIYDIWFLLSIVCP